MTRSLSESPTERSQQALRLNSVRKEILSEARKSSHSAEYWVMEFSNRVYQSGVHTVRICSTI